VCQKNILIVSGGTGGHIYPGIVLAKEFRDSGYEPIFFISDNVISRQILEKSGFKYIISNVVVAPQRISVSFISFFIKTLLVFLKALRQIVILKPLVVVGTGGYITVPVLFASKILHKKIFIHEQNAVPGKANILLNRIAIKTFISFRSLKKKFKNRNVLFVGCPIREDILYVSKEKAIKTLNLNRDLFTILIFGGSLGSSKLNQVTCQAFLELFYNDKTQILHVTGFRDYVYIKRQVKEYENYRVYEYMHDIEYAYAASDIVICRSGAGTVFELKVLNKPAILVPYSYATDEHQYWNAKEIESEGKVIIIEEKYFTSMNLKEAISELKSNIKNIEINMTKNANILAQKLIFEEIMKCIKF
jgi:UDP-N-acetylglucosamine--N-acetylmuramyl-(pentapeptide) pyrophosphoryl-undecaprenol N-acetylglucosamine transferase